MSEEYQSRSRSKSNLLALNYDRRYPNLKVARKCKSYLATMGLPRSNGEHFLWPEEAVYLLETCSAVIFANDRPLTVLEAYRILEEKKVPHFKYLIYATLKKSGFVVVRPNRKEAASKLSRNDSKPTIVEKDSRAHLLDCFPSLDKNGLHLPFIGLNTLTPGICNDLQPPHLSVLQFTRDSNRLAPCRPQYMPELGKIIEAKNWKEFILLKNMTLNRKNRYKKSYTARGNGNDVRKYSEIDFELYPTTYSFHSPLEPTYRVICFDASNGPLNIQKLSTDYKNTSIIIALYQLGKINFIHTSGQEINLFTLFKTLSS